jgi:peptide/nickel transport system permease protein
LLRMILVRTGLGVVFMALLSTAIFALLSLLPGDPVEMFILSNPRVRTEDVLRLKKLRGLDRGFSERYSRWLIGHHPPLAPPDIVGREPVVVDLEDDRPLEVAIDVAPLLLARGQASVGETPPLTLIPLFGARARGHSLTITVDQPGLHHVWFIVKDAHGQTVASRVDVVARLPPARVRERISPSGLDDRLIDTSPELDIDVLDPEPREGLRTIRLVPPFFVEERGQTVALRALVDDDESPVRGTILAGPGHIEGDRYHPPEEPGRHAVVVTLQFADGATERGAFTVETEPLEDRTRFVRGALYALIGDLEALGFSSSYKRPIHELLFDGGKHGRLFMTLSLMLPAFLLAFLFALPLGVLAALRRGTFIDRAVLTLSTTTLSLPIFFIGVIVVVVFAERLRLLPSGGAMTPGFEGSTVEVIADRVRHLVLPASVLALGVWASLVRHVRGALIEVLSAEFLVAARARGLKEHVVILKHALKNAMPPVVTATALFLPSLVGGALFVETIFAWPGIGRMQYEAVLANDHYLAMVIFLLEAALVLVASLLSDIVVMRLDPRTRRSA